MTTNLVESFRDLTSEQEGPAGGKGGTLARLYQHGYPVPEGFVVFPAAFQDARLSPGAWEEILTRLRAIPIRHPGEEGIVRVLTNPEEGELLYWIECRLAWRRRATVRRRPAVRGAPLHRRS